ncbi:MAG: Prolyl-tRNA synthetase [Parcubacteria group bacterium GW2011_GWC1_43_11b]|uniref:Proline--tRNA ligase n=2 Tax=Candidatus Vogeliibacteriota TaxID=1817922 RepID=A0A1G2QEI4_9BACT|nr:MAG: Proline-tRNA ligase [Parcubacteria group bacterium GW2011_GWB1_42_9]KKS89494.1 MAG: Prolyl-tRNA synthetase [Parcubacteria group bacterium GW2011_GWC1_43_11b]KKT10151.1 MAG: Proline-tRNA ligase [Parcubacteria group bacterium GW2011_GWA1_43_21]OHA59015.1 MAG: prolyl-tRNA synthetase [Candidatus Vogelbacteria bacterium RIFOXYB1_FULL_42_16]OHA60346.1 MAG: prolyl-tRNA synthetase [Candidatus Vogelbacteria bacterium RIFOXYD1_FULL_42_15]
MLQSQLFVKTRREDPKDEVAKNAKLLIRAGYIHKELAGAYSLLPLGLKTLNKINAIIRDEMNKLGANEIQMTALQSADLWQKTDRWSDDKVDNWFKTSLKAGGDLGLGFTHEEPITVIASESINSYKDLPLSIYQIQTKFRNEARAKSGIMRGREFLMKDLYSFHADANSLDEFYLKAQEAYKNVFARLGIGDKTFVTFAGGGSFSEFSHEYQTICETGEDTIYLDRAKKIAVNKEVYNEEVLTKLGLDKTKMEEVKAVEVGNIFKLGTRFSEPLGLLFSDEKGERRPVIMGCYGIGPSRLLGLLTEVFADEQGLIWPLSVAPFQLHLISLEKNDEALKLYDELTKKGIEVLIDDRDLSAGAKFADADLLGVPYRVVVSAKGLSAGQYEIKNRQTGETDFVPVEEFPAWVEKTIRL